MPYNSKRKGANFVTNLNKAQELIYWHNNADWYTHVDGKGVDGYSIKTDAPERAKKSFEAWKKHQNKAKSLHTH